MPSSSTNGYPFNDTYWKDPNYRVIVYGTPRDVPNNVGPGIGPLYSNISNRMEYRYLGYDSAGNKFSNKFFRDDVNLGIELKDKNWIKNPWNYGLCVRNTTFDKLDNPIVTQDLNRMYSMYGFYPHGGNTFVGYGNIQSYPTLKAQGSFRMWHEENGHIYYQTFSIPVKPDKLSTEFSVATEILSDDFTIGPDESTVNVIVKVTGHLYDEAYYSNDLEKGLHYTRDDVKKWDIKVEYKDTYSLVTLDPCGSNTASNTFALKFSRGQIADKENIVFNGVARVTFHNDKYYRDADPKTAKFNVLTPPPAAELPPDITITAPVKANVNQSYTVRVNPIVPPGESIKSVTLQACVNGGAFQNVTLSGYSATQQYGATGTISYRAVVTLNNGKSASAMENTSIVDERSSDATARIEQPNIAYEGHWITVKNKNTFKFEGVTYNAVDADELGIGSSYFEIQDNSLYDLDTNLYQTRNFNENVSFQIKYIQPGIYKNTLWAMPRNGNEVSDTDRVQVLRCPDIIADIGGTRKANRKMTLDFSGTVTHPDFPLDDSRTYVVIEDVETGEKVTCTNSSSPDSANIKTNDLSGNKMDFLIKTTTDKTYKATIYVEDIRGYKDIHFIEFSVVQDKAPVARISARAQELRKPSLSNKAEILLQDDSCSEDGDYMTRTWEIALDTDNDGSFADETYIPAEQLDGFQDLSGDGSLKKIRFLKTGVGKLNARVIAKEVFGQPTIDAFVTPADRREATGMQAIDVINVAPNVDFKLYSNPSATINLVVGSLSDDLQASLQNSIASLQSQLIENRITPTINLIPRSLNVKNPVWNQQGGNPQKTGMSKFNAILNTNVKWAYTTDVPVDIDGGGATILASETYITAEGNLFVAVHDRSGLDHISILSPQGTLLDSAIIPSGKYAFLSNGNFIWYKASDPNIKLYNKNLDLIKTYTLPSPRTLNTEVTVDNQDRLHFGASYINSQKTTRYLYLYIMDCNLKVLYSPLVRTTQTSNEYNSIKYETWILADSAGCSYFAMKDEIYKYDANGNFIWLHDNGSYNAVEAILDEAENVLFEIHHSAENAYIRKINSTTGEYMKEKKYSRDTYGRLENMTMTDTELLIAGTDKIRLYCFSKGSLNENGSLGAVGEDVEKAIVSADGAIFTYSRYFEEALMTRHPQFGGQRMNSHEGRLYVVSSAVLGSNNTFYITGAYYLDSNTTYDYARCTGNVFVLAYGTGGTEQNIDNTLRKLNENIPSGSGTDFVVSITDAPFQDNTDTNIAGAASLLKSKNDRFLMIGNTKSKADGQRILNNGVSGSLYNINANMTTPVNSIASHIISILSPIDKKVYEYYYDKGETVNYEVFYTDYELDPSRSSQWRYYHTPKSDGTISDNGVWLSSPIMQFIKNGTYRVQHRQMDNTGVAAYDHYSNIIELTIHIEDGEAVPPPVPVYNPVGSIEFDGPSKQNRKLTLKLNYSADNVLPLNPGTISWTLTPVDGMTAADIKRTSLMAQSIDTLYKKPGRVKAVCTFRDTGNNPGSVETEFDIAPDIAPAGSVLVTPVTYRNGSGIASINVKAEVSSPDDFIDSIKYYITYDADNNGSFDNDTEKYLPQYDNLRDFNIDVNTGVGNYMIRAVCVEGFREPTIPAFVTDADYLSLVSQGVSMVDNISPVYDISPEKGVYLVGEEIRFKAFDGSFLNGVPSKGFFDAENDCMTGFRVKYIQNKEIMPSRDATSVYHNQTLTDFAVALDRAGEYTLEVNAYDDPKNGDIRFSSFSRPSNTNTNRIIVHRRPAAALSFEASHGEAPVYDFGNGRYLDGTSLKISDASMDPDGFAVTSSISYKADGGSYVHLNSGDTISLYYGSVFTVKVVATDNWGVDDTAIYTITVVNGLDMVPEVIPHTIPASENITLRLTTNQYATGARAVIFGQSLSLPLKSQTAAQKVWEIEYTIHASRPDGEYETRFHAVSEGATELYKDVGFRVLTPINLVPGMPAETAAGAGITINAATSKYAGSTTVQLFRDTPYQTQALAMTGAAAGSTRNWTLSYTIPAEIPAGNYSARFISTTPNGNTQTVDVTFRIETLKITGVALTGYWNHWRGQVDMFGKRMSTEPHRFLSLEKVKVDVHTMGFAERVEIRFSPVLEAMQFTDGDGNRYDYHDDFGLEPVNFPVSFLLDGTSAESSLHWEYTLPLAPSTVGWDDIRLRPHYQMTVTAWKGEYSVTYTIDDIDVTGNIYDLTYIQPVN